MRWPWVIARELGLPQGWIDDPARVQAAGVPDQVGFTFIALLLAVFPRSASTGQCEPSTDLY